MNCPIYTQFCERFFVVFQKALYSGRITHNRNDRLASNNLFDAFVVNVCYKSLVLICAAPDSN